MAIIKNIRKQTVSKKLVTIRERNQGVVNSCTIK
jgi:hypothetical protein